MSTRVLRGFDCFRPRTLNEAIGLVSECRERAHVLAGGTDVLVAMKSGESKPDVLISLERLKGLRFIGFSDEAGLELGPLISIRALETSETIKCSYPLLAEAASQFASIQIVNMATIGGNICNASPAGDMLPPLMTMNAEIDLLSAEGKRTVNLTDFYVGPGKTVMKPAEILTQIRAAALPDGYGSCFKKVSRTAEDLSKISVAVILSERDGRFSEVRLSIGAAAPVPIRAFEAESFINDREVSDAAIHEAARIASEETRPIDDRRSTAAYRKDIVSVAVTRAIATALARSNVP